MASFRVTVIGCGLIGGSLALALRRRRPDCRVAALDRPEALPAIQEARVADVVGPLDRMADHLPGSDLVVLAGPVLSILDHLEVIGPHLSPGTIVTDVGSTKEMIVDRARRHLPETVHFIGGHPVAGSQTSGVTHADPLLFNQHVWCLCPATDTPSEAMLTLMAVVEDLLAVPVTIEPEEHDRLMAMVSHMPQLLAIALMHGALEADHVHNMLEMVAGRGFLDLTRIAASDYTVWEGILATNAEAIDLAFDRLEQSMAQVRRDLRDGNLAALWRAVSNKRSKMGPDSLPRPRQPDLRKLIDRFDEQMLKALGKRMAVVKKIGRDKALHQGPIHDPDRERRLLAQRQQWARSCDLDPDFVQDLFERIMDYSKQMQTRQTGSGGGDDTP